jgi:diphthamide synthase (EF-2-diphthine--ammonia ligase)
MALHSLLRNPEFEVLALVTTVTEGFDRISMQGVRRELLFRQAESIGLPLEEVRTPPNCVNPVHESRMAETALRFRKRGLLHV